MYFDCTVLPVSVPDITVQFNSGFNWKNVTQDQKYCYSSETQPCLYSIDIPVDSSRHISKIEVFYKSINDSLIEECDQSGLSRHSSAVINNVKSIPGWNSAVKAHHANARKAYLEWRNFGKHNNGQLFHAMTSYRKIFKSELRKYKYNAEMHKANTVRVPGVDHEGRQTCRQIQLLMLCIRILQKTFLE